ncbi:hypothetical protein KW805_01575 [Candidatus Pacearchaeota archaeon]|nr:hypothetical protein [Candidatus Pacearchaeota archaeon]
MAGPIVNSKAEIVKAVEGRLSAKGYLSIEALPASINDSFFYMNKTLAMGNREKFFDVTLSSIADPCRYNVSIGLRLSKDNVSIAHLFPNKMFQSMGSPLHSFRWGRKESRGIEYLADSIIFFANENPSKVGESLVFMIEYIRECSKNYGLAQRI